MASDAPHLMIAIPCRNDIRATVFPELIGCILDAALYWSRTYPTGRVSVQVYPRSHVVTARNAAVDQARADDVDWILWVDDDMSPPPQFLERLHGTGKDFVGAVAYKREPPYTPCVSRFVGDEAIPFDPEPDDGLIEADFTGFACILTHRAVVDAVYERTNGQAFQLRGKLGEDYFFCAQASIAGFQLHILSDLVVGHLADVVIGREHRRPYMQTDPATNKHTRNLPNIDGNRMETQWLAK